MPFSEKKKKKKYIYIYIYIYIYQHKNQGLFRKITLKYKSSQKYCSSKKKKVEKEVPPFPPIFFKSVI